MNPINEKLLEWLERTPAALANLVVVARQFYADQGTIDLGPTSADRPHQWRAGEIPVLTTVALSDAQIDALNRGMAEAWVKEKALEFVKGFIMGVSMAA
jgi:hypothetical protein